MLKGISPLLGPDLLAALRAMGHGDEIAIVDGNYPADAHGRRVVRADGLGSVALLDAVLSVMPLDDSVEDAVFLPDAPAPQAIHGALRDTVARHEGMIRAKVLRDGTFYDRAKAAYCIVATSEPSLYANIILRKGVIRPE